MAPYVQLLGVQPSASAHAGSVHHPSHPSRLGWSTDIPDAGGYAGSASGDAGTHVWVERSGLGEHAMMGGMSQLLEDIEMSDSEPALLDGGRHYLALDTNVLIDHLALVRAMYTVCRDVGRGRLVLLIPSVVINELDGLSSSSSSSSSGSSSPARPSLVSSSARSATAFLLSTYRVKSPLPLPDDSGMRPARDPAVTAALRCQRWSERLDRAISKPDDRVLDCCLFFRSREGVRSVTLWTADRNLALLAESNDVRTISRPTELQHALHALRRLDLDSEDQFWERLERVCVSGVSRRAGGPDDNSAARTEPALEDLNDDGMELDHDLLTDNGMTHRDAHDAALSDAFLQSEQTPLSRSPQPGEPSDDFSFRRYAPIPPSSSTLSIPRAPSPPLSLPSRIPRVKRIIPQSILSDLTSLFLPISLHLPPPATPPPPPTTSTSTFPSTFPSTSLSISSDSAHPPNAPLTLSNPPHLLLSHLLSQLLSAESRLSALSIPLLRTISHLRTVHAFVDASPPPDARPPRTGEVAEALEELGSLWVVLGVSCHPDEFARVASEVRALS